LAIDGDHAACLRLQEKLMPLHELMFVEANPIPVKWALQQMGLMGGEIRLPMTPLSTSHQAAMQQTLRDLELI
jgi:4-hydroxy-tetrahydrodipicolinate synthase